MPKTWDLYFEFYGIAIHDNSFYGLEIMCSANIDASNLYTLMVTY